MKIKDLAKMIEGRDPEADVLVRLDGSIFPTDTFDEHQDYNDGAEVEFFVLALEDFT